LKTFVEDFLDQDLSNVLVSRQGGDPFWILEACSTSEKVNKGKLITSTEVFSFYLGVPRSVELHMGEDVPLSNALPPLPPAAKVVGKTFRYSGLSHSTRMIPDQFLMYSF
jgi:hypothetical protein